MSTNLMSVKNEGGLRNARKNVERFKKRTAFEN